MEEIWKPVKNFEGLYSVSSLGRVKSLGNGGFNQYQGKETILKPYANHHGYLQVNLRKNGKNHCKRINRLVAEAFIHNDDPEHKTQCNHINELVTDNRASNLEWMSPSQNINYGNRNKKVSEKTRNDHKRSKPVLQYTLDGVFVKEWPSLHEINRVLGFHRGHISDCCKRKPTYKQAYGYIWRFASDVDKEKGAA